MIELALSMQLPRYRGFNHTREDPAEYLLLAENDSTLTSEADLILIME